LSNFYHNTKFRQIS